MFNIARGTTVADIDVQNKLRNHLAFQVDDLADARGRFEAAGVEIIEAGAAYSEERDFHQERFFVRDPGGNLLEILEPRRVYASVPH